MRILFLRFSHDGVMKMIRDLWPIIFMELTQNITNEERYKSDTLENDVEEIYNNLDMDKNGYIGYEEFVRAAVSKEYFVKDNILRFAFRYFDKDNSGEITFNEIEDLFTQGIEDKNKVHETLLNIIKEVDVNNDGTINFEEFSKVMKRMIK